MRYISTLLKVMILLRNTTRTSILANLVKIYQRLTIFSPLSTSHASEEDRECLSEQFSVPELLEAIKSLPSNKSSGENGFPLELNKEFRELLIYYLMEVLKKAREDNCFPESFSQTVITVINKKGKNLLKYASYRPISLLNTDCKLVNKMHCKSLKSSPPLLVIPDKTCFIINRFSSNNLRRVFDIIHLGNKTKYLVFQTPSTC
jgi:hypothetical protein